MIHADALAVFRQDASRSRRVPMAVLYDFIFKRYHWTIFDILEMPQALFDELQQVWVAEGEAIAAKGPKVAETHEELLAQARAQGFATTPEEYARELGQAG